MKENGKDNLNDMEKTNTNSMDEIVHYEIKFVETEDGFRLEASGDKEALRRLGIGPNMVPNLGSRKRRPGRGRRARQLRRMNRQQKRQAAMARRFNRTHQPWAVASFGQPGYPIPRFGPRKRFHGRHCTGHDPESFGPHPESGDKGHTETWNW